MAAPFFNIEMLPARYGDCLWLEYGAGGDVHRLLVDGGPVSTFSWIEKRLKEVPMNEREFELVVLSHVDADHIEGLVRLFADKPLPFAVDEVWFNGWRQMKKAHGLLGAEQGEFLSALLVDRAPKAWKQNAGAKVVRTQRKLPRYTLAGGLVLTLLSPTPATLDKMAKAWEKDLKKAKKQRLQPGDLEAAWAKLATKKKFLPKQGLLGAAPDLDDLLTQEFPLDQAAPNGSSIAFLAEFAGKSALFLADAHPQVIAGSVQRLCAERQTDRLAVDAVKVSHHGSKHNTSATLVRLLQSASYLISSNGEKFDHPDKECIAQILKLGKPKRLYFNYRSEYTKPWLTKTAQSKHHYEAIVRPDSALTIKVSL
jgi:beta-lactamase superfamily II metal-dependent hydrolase